MQAKKILQGPDLPPDTTGSTVTGICEQLSQAGKITIAKRRIRPTMFTDAVLADLARAASIGADDMHITLNLAPVDPERQANHWGRSTNST
ncbi:hypothetical protein ACTWPB_22540 [Nocardia sp. IBHARD005]|uniref:hypothetical protein n=1 Tax=Nocardia sp. IBHARD005 TaxID=3457765 RepID=UPI004059ADA7